MATSPLTQALSELREELTIGIITDVCASPMNRQVADQRKAERFCKTNRLDDVPALQVSDVPAAVCPIPTPSTGLTLVRLSPGSD